MDTSFRILWTTKAVGSSGRVSVFLHSDVGELLLAENLPDTGGFLADLRGMRLPPTIFFRVKVIDAGHPGRMDFSSLFSIGPAIRSRVHFREPAAGAVLQLDSSYTFRLELPAGPTQDFDLLLLQDGDVVAYLPADLSGSELTVRMSGTGVGSGTGFRFRLEGNQWAVDPPPYFGVSEPFAIASDYFGGVAFSRPGPSDTLAGGSVDTLVHVKQGNPGYTEVLGIFMDTLFYGPLDIVERINLDDTTRIIWRVPAGVATDSRYRIGVVSARDPNLPVSFSERFTILGVEPDAFEPDDDPETAGELRPGEPAQVRTLPDMDTDWVGFDAEAGRSYAIRIRGHMHIRFAVRQDAADIPAHALDTGYPPTEAVLIVRPEKAGRCLARIESIWPTLVAMGRGYAISLHRLEMDSAGMTIRFTAPAPGATVRAGEATLLRWAPDSVLFDSAVRIELYRDSVQVRTLAEAAPNSGTFAWTVDPWFEDSRSYRIRISRMGAREIFGQSQPFHIDGIPRDAYEPDDSRSLAKRIVPGSPAQARSLLVSDTDWVAFACRPGATYRVAATSSFSLILNVFADLRRMTGGINPSLSDVRGVGECAVQVMPYQSQAGEYGLSVAEEPQ